MRKIRGSSQIMPATVTAVELAASVAGDGLTGGAGSALAVNLSATGGLVIAADALGIKLDGATLVLSASGLKMGALTGDVTSVALVTTLATVNANIGTFGSATKAPVITVNAKGLITAASEITVTPAASSITGGAALTTANDTNVTATAGGSAATALLAGASITMGWTGTLAAARLNANVVQGITNDTNVTGSIAAQVLTLGWTGTLAAARLNSNVVQSVVNDTNVTGSIAAQALTLGWTGTLGVTRGGTGTGTAVTAGSVMFAGASGIYAQDNANLFWDDTNNRLGIGTSAPNNALELSGGAISFFRAAGGFTATGIDYSSANDTLRLRYNFGGGNLNTTALEVFRATGFCNFPASAAVGFSEGITSSGLGLLTLASTQDVNALTMTFDNATTNFRNSLVNHFDSAVPGNNRLTIKICDKTTTGQVETMSFLGNGNVGVGTTTATARLHLAAGTATASTAPLKFTSGTLLTTPEAGAVEFNTDDFFATITTAAARKAFVLDNGARLTSGKVPVATTNGRLIDGPTLGVAGLKIPAIQAAGTSNAQTAAVASIAAFTLSAADGIVVIAANVNVTTSVLHSFSVQIDYTDETNTAQTATLTFTQLNAASVSVITNGTGTGPYEGVVLTLRCKASTSVTAKTTGTFTSVTYNVGVVMTQLT